MITKLPEGIEDGEAIKEISGKLTAVFPAETRNGQYGEYTTQNCKIQIDGTEYKLSLMNHVVPNLAKGKVIVLKCTKDDKKGFIGVNYKVETYTSKKGANKGKEVTENVIKCNASANIEYPDGTPADAKAQDKPTSKPQNAQASDSYTNYQRPQSFDELVEVIAKQHATVHTYVHALYEEDKLSTETLQAYVASVWIEANRQGANTFYEFKGQQGHSKAKEQVKEEPEKPMEKDAEWTGDEPAQEEAPDEVPDETPEEEPANPYGMWEEQKVPSGPKAGMTLAEIGKVTIGKYYESYKAKGFATDFQKFVRQAAIDLGIAKNEEEIDDIP